MAIVVELLSKDGKVIQHFHVEKPQITIGRAYDNDVRIDDPYICPHHVCFEEQADSKLLVASDLESLNGVKINGDTDHSKHLGYNDIVTIGRSRIRTFKPCQQVAPTLVLSKLEENMEWLSLRRVCIAILAIFTALIATKYFANNIGEFNLSVLVKVLMAGALTAAIWPLFFALLSKLAKKEPRIISQLSMVWLFMISTELLDYIKVFVEFNSGATTVIYWLALLAKSLLFFTLLWFTLFIAFHQSKSVRNGIAITGTLLISLYTLMPHFFGKTDFNPNPSYSAKILTPNFRLASANNTQSFVEDSQMIFDDLKQEMQKVQD